MYSIILLKHTVMHVNCLFLPTLVIPKRIETKIIFSYLFIYSFIISSIQLGAIYVYINQILIILSWNNKTGEE